MQELLTINEIISTIGKSTNLKTRAGKYLAVFVKDTADTSREIARLWLLTSGKPYYNPNQ